MSESYTLRRGAPKDAAACHQILWESATDLGQRHGTPLQGTAEEWWRGMEPVHRFLADHAYEWWVAEGGDPRRVIGYARSIARSGLLELTELFVRPGEQSRGVGRALMERTFPAGRGAIRTIIATTDVRALARYHAAGVIARFPVFTLTAAPVHDGAGQIRAIPLDGEAGLRPVREIERAVLGYPRGDAELGLLLDTRDGYAYERDGEQIGFAFVGSSGAGPLAALDPSDLPEILLHVEGRARAMGVERLELEVPALNEVALRHLLGRGYRIDPWINLLMSSEPFGQFDRFIGFSPPLFL